MKWIKKLLRSTRYKRIKLVRKVMTECLRTNNPIKIKKAIFNFFEVQDFECTVTLSYYYISFETKYGGVFHNVSLFHYVPALRYVIKEAYLDYIRFNFK